MSAFLVEPQQITEIVKWACEPSQGAVNYAYNCVTKEQISCEPKNMVKLLAQANIDSLVARYGDSEEDYVGYVQDCLDILPYSTDGICISLYSGVGVCQLEAKDIYNMLSCWDYQSCEVDNWYDTDAYWLGQYISDACARKMAKDAVVTWNFMPKFTPNQLREAYK
jgi:hypothetical protein